MKEIKEGTRSMQAYEIELRRGSTKRLMAYATARSNLKNKKKPDNK